MSDIVKITLRLPDQEALNIVLSTARLSLECGRPKQDENGDYIVVVYGSSDDAKKIAKLKYKIEVDETFGDELKKRQNEVSKIDRFKGGTVVPKGLGTKY